MHLRHRAGDPARVEVPPAHARAPGEAFVDVALDRRFPETVIRRVDGELARLRRHLDVRMRQQEFAQRRVEREAGHAIAHAEHEHRRRPVQRVAGGHLGRARLQEVAFDDVAPAVDGILRRAQDGEDAADRDVDVDAARAVERIEHEQVLAAGMRWGHLERVRHLLRRHARELAAPLVHADEEIAADAARRPGRAGFLLQRVAQPALRDDACDRLAGERDVEDQCVEVAARLRESTAFLDQVACQRPASGHGHGCLP